MSDEITIIVEQLPNIGSLTQAGAVLKTDTSTADFQFVVDEDDFISDSDTKVPTQQSVKNYIANILTSRLSFGGEYDAATNTPDLINAVNLPANKLFSVVSSGVFYTDNLEPGDLLISKVEDPLELSDWIVINRNLDPVLIKQFYESNPNTNAFTDLEQSKLEDIEFNADVTDFQNVRAAGALMDIELTSLDGIKTLSIPINTTVTNFVASLLDEPDAAAFRAAIGVAIPVTLAGENYLSINGSQQITAAPINLSGTNVTGVLPAIRGGTGTTGVTGSGLAVLNTNPTINQPILTLRGSINPTPTAEGVIEWDTDHNRLVIGSGSSSLIFSDDSFVLNRQNHTGTQPASTIVGGTFANNLISQSSVTQHQAALQITESQIVDLDHSVDFVSNVASNTILGRIDTGSGNSQELTPAQVRTIINVENGATADQTGAEIKALYQLEPKAYTDAKDDKLAGIEANADVTDANNVEAAGAVMESDTSTALMQFVLDEDDMASNSATKLATQQSIKAYVDNVANRLVRYKENYNATTNTPNLTTPTAVKQGDLFRVSAAGNFYTETLEIGDALIALVDNPTVITNWLILNRNLTPALIKQQYESNSNTNAFTDALLNKLNNIEAFADVTDNANVRAAGALMDDEVTSLTGIKSLTIPDNVVVSTYIATLLNDSDAATARATLGAAVPNTLAGQNYLSIDSNQQITANPIALNSTNTSGILPILKGGTGTSTATGSGSVVLQLSPQFLGIPTAPTASQGTDTQQLATTGFVQLEKENILSRFRASKKFFVSTRGNDNNSGLSPAEPLATLDQAVALSEAGDVIEMEAGTYFIDCPLRIPRDVGIQGDSLRQTILKPLPGTELNGFFKVDSGFYCDGLTFAGHQSNGVTTAFAIALDDEADNTALGASGLGAYIFKSPYVRNCTSYTAQDDDGTAGSLSTGPTGGGFIIDGDACAPNSPIRSFVVDSFTQINLNGPGGLIKNNGYCQLVSCFGTFCSYHVRCESGGQVNLSNSTSNFGEYGLMASGYSPNPIFTGTVQNPAYGKSQVLVTTVTFDEVTNTVLANNHQFINGDRITFNSTQGNLPAEIQPSTRYYVVNRQTNSFQFSLTEGGAPVNITDNGSVDGVFEAKVQGDNSISIINLTANTIGPVSRPLPGMLMFLNNRAYVITGSTPILNGSSQTIGYVVDFYSQISGGLFENISIGTIADFRLRSQIATGGHNMEYVGAGTNYFALPWYGGIPNPARQVFEENEGKVFFTTTDELGNFKVGNAFDVDGTTGAVTINTDQFNISGLNFIGPFSRNGGFSTVGVQLREVSDNPNLISSTGAPDSNTVPTQVAVIDYLENNYVDQTTNQTIDGTKTFLDSPIVPTPTTNTQVTNKQYVDNNALRVNGTNSMAANFNVGGFNITNVGLVDGVDVSARDHDSVTLAGSLDYLTLNNQQITLNAIDLDTDVTGSFSNTSLKVKGLNSNHLSIVPNETLTANRTLNIVVGDTNRTLTLTGNASISGTNTGDQTISITGDITAVGTQSVLNASINNNAVTLAKLQQVSSNTILGRISTSTGNVESLTASQVRTIINVEEGATADQTGAEIKALYELEPKAYTDTKDTKLAGIEAGAQVNTVNSVNSQLGNVVLDADDIDDTLTINKFTTQAEIDKLAGIEPLADVTDTANVRAAGALMDDEVVSLTGIKSLTVPDNTTVSNYGANLIASLDAASAQVVLGIDELVANNTTDVTLSGQDYLSIIDQVITANPINLASTNVTNTLPVARGGTGVTTSTGTGSTVLSNSPAFTGIPTAPTAPLGTDTTQLATTEYVRNELEQLRKGTKWYVSPNGDDNNSGDTIAAPFATLDRAVEACSPGDVIELEAGTFFVNCPLIIPRDVGIQGDALRQTILRPVPGTEFNGFFKVDSGFYCDGITFAGHQADNTQTAFVISFDETADNTALGASTLGAYILKSPYIRNCTSYTAEDDDGTAGSLSTGNTGGGMEIDGSKCAPESPIRSIVVDSFTQVNLNGPGCLVKNNGYAQLVSFFGTFCSYHVRCESGGQVNLSNSTTNFGTFGLMADGYSPEPIFTGTIDFDAYGTPTIRIIGVQFNSSTDTVLANNHGLVNGDKVTFRATENALPIDIDPSLRYYVINSQPNTFQISTSPTGTAVSISEDGVGPYEAKLQGDNEITVTDLTDNEVGPISRPLPGMLMFINNIPYIITGSTPITGGYVVTFYNSTSGGLQASVTSGTFVDFRLRSQIATGGHNMEYVGAGTNYLALPWYGGVPIPENQIVETNEGRVFYSTTDELGNFKVGDAFSVDGTTGAVTISTDQFNLSGLNFIGPFSRDGGFSTVGVQLREVSNNIDLIASTGAPDGNTVPTQFAVSTYTQNNYLALDGSNQLTANLNLGGFNIINVGLVDGVDISARDHDAVTVTDSSEINFTLTGQNITASLFNSSITTDKLSSGVNNSLALANTSLQPNDIGVTVQGYNSVLDNTTASFTTQQEIKLGYITVTQDVDLDLLEQEINALTNGMVYKGIWDASTGVFPGGGAAQIGWFYYVSVSGTVDGVQFDVGDNIVAINEPASTTTYANNWSKHDQTDAVQSVAGKVGNVTLVAADITDFDTEVSNNIDVAANTSLRHAAVTVTDSAEIDFTLTGQNITASIVPDSIDESKLNTSVNSSLDLADSSLQPEDIGVTIQGYSSILQNTTASFTTADETKLDNISITQPVNLDTIESDVALNNAARHEAVTVTDSAEIAFTLTGQNVTASIVAGSIDESKLDVSVNNSLDLADSSLQPEDIGISIQGYSSILQNTTASFTTVDETKLDNISITQPVNLDTLESDVALNNAARHSAVTLAGSYDYLTLSGQQITLNQIDLSTDVTGSLPQASITNLVSDLSLKAPLASPTFTGAPKAPTPLATDNSTNIATTAYVTTAINEVRISPVTITTANNPYTPSNKELLLVDSTNGPITINLPAAGSDFVVYISDVSGTAYTNNIIINSNGTNTIQGNSSLVIDNNYSSVSIAIDSASTDWKTAAINIPSGIGLTPKLVSTNYTATKGELLLVDTSNSSISINLSSSGKDNLIRITDISGNARNNNIVINPIGGYTIRGSNQLVISNNNGSVLLAADQFSTDWKIADYSVDTLVKEFYDSAITLNAIINTHYIVDTTSNAITATLPNSPNNGATIAFSDYKGNFSLNNLTINCSGTNTLFDGIETQLILDNDFSLIELTYWNGNWSVVNGQSFVDNGIGGGGSGGGSGGGLSIAYHNTSTLSPTDQTVYQLDTGSNAITVTLPSAPANGTWYGFCDYDGTFATNNVTINRSGTDTIINGTDTSITLDSNFSNLWLAYYSGNWSVISAESFVDAGGGGGLSNPVAYITQSIQTVTYNDGGTSTMDNGTHNVFSLTANGTSTTIAHSNVPATGTEYQFRLHLTWTSGTITWPESSPGVTSWTKGMNAPSATGNYIISGLTIDGGTSWTITVTYQ